jgi:hypothetical protein
MEGFVIWKDSGYFIVVILWKMRSFIFWILGRRHIGKWNISFFIFPLQRL